MALDKQAESWLQGMAETGLPPLNEMSVEDARAAYREAVKAFGIAAEPVEARTDLTIPGPAGSIPVRVYTPRGSGPFPVLVYFHGGGWVIGDLDTCDGPCTVLCNRAHTVVVSVNYRLAPEHKFPAAVEDCYAAMRWATLNGPLLNGDSERVAVGGDSAGATMAIVVSAMARDEGVTPPLFQLLIYPPADVNLDTASRRDNGNDYFLTTKMMRWFFEHYLADPSQESDWRVSPLRIPDPTGLPPALVLTAEYDPLRDEGELLAAMLVRGGATVTTKCYLGQMHGFVASIGGAMDRGREALELAGGELRHAFRAGWSPKLW
jgi:acetyl esterase